MPVQNGDPAQVARFFQSGASMLNDGKFELQLVIVLRHARAA
jgi:hypothetical protein